MKQLWARRTNVEENYGRKKGRCYKEKTRKRKNSKKGMKGGVIKE